MIGDERDVCVTDDELRRRTGRATEHLAEDRVEGTQVALRPLRRLVVAVLLRGRGRDQAWRMRMPYGVRERAELGQTQQHGTQQRQEQAFHDEPRDPEHRSAQYKRVRRTRNSGAATRSIMTRSARPSP